MGVGIEDGVDAADAEAQRLLAEVRPGVDEDTPFPVLILPFNGYRWASAAVAGIGRGADAAGAAQRRHTHGCAAAEKQEAGLGGRQGLDLLPCRRLSRRVVRAGGDG